MRRNRKSSSSPDFRGELALIERIRSRSSGVGPGLALGIGDDCALLRLKSTEELAITTDLSIAGRHFRLETHPAEAVGHRALARGLSDLAAMGAKPLAAFLSLGLPRSLTIGRRGTAAWIDRFFDGFLALAAKYKVPLAGGDLSQSPLPIADIVLTGVVPRGRALLRSGAKAGDIIYVTGSLGGSAHGLARLGLPKGKRLASKLGSAGAPDPLNPHLFPRPRISQGLWLQRKRAASAAIDISDGLSTDLEHICHESGVCAEIDAKAIPTFPGASLEQAIHGGEDYELLFTAHPRSRIPSRISGIPITPIGRVLGMRAARPAVVLITPRGRLPLVRRGWQHFA